jgi:Undecaprenyl-phosphate galactose phosphotransferase WbaP
MLPISRRLSLYALWQSVVGSIPLLISDFVTYWMTLLVVSGLLERLFGLPHSMVTRKSAVFSAVVFTLVVKLLGLYPAFGTSPVVEMRNLTRAALTSLLIFTGTGLVAHLELSGFYVISAIVSLLLLVPLLPVSRFLARRLAVATKLWGARVMIYADARDGLVVYRNLQRSADRGLLPVALVLSSDDQWAPEFKSELQGIPTIDLRGAAEFANENLVTWAIVVPRTGDTPRERSREVAEINSALFAIPNRVLLSSLDFDFGIWDRTHTVGTSSGVLLANARYCSSNQVVKRAFDIILTSIGLLLISPVLLFIAAAIKLSSRGPIFYSQARIGLNGVPFRAWKFRSMVCNADAVLERYLAENPEMRLEWEQNHKLKRDPRITWIGSILRKTSLDELPQLWNVLKGEMSLVGPRPIVNSPTFDATYIEDYPNEYRVYTMFRPGLTGLWQVTCRNSGVYEMRIYLDMYYIRNWSLWLDLFIILRTIRTVLLREGAY